jgi:predicted ATP-grasp superfamily ATP-dependent carboligase
MWTALIYMLSSGIELGEIFWRVDRNNEINSIAIASCESELDFVSADM